MGLSHIIADFAADAAASTEFPGLALPAVEGYRRVVPEACAGCSKADESHKCWARVGVDPNFLKTVQQERVAAGNAINEKLRRLESIIQLNDRSGHGLCDLDELGVGGYPPASHYFGWPLLGISGQTVTLQWAAGTPQPNSVGFSQIIDNPDYPGLDENGDPEPAKLTITSHNAIPARGVFGVSGNSRLGLHAGWIVRAIHVPADFEEGDSFTVELETPIGALAAQRVPGNTDPITGGIRVYMLCQEQYTHTRDTLPLWVARAATTKVIDAPAAEKIPLEAEGRIRPAEAGTQWVKVEKKVGGVWSEEGAWPVRIEHTAGGYRTVLDLEEADLGEGETAVTAVRVTYHPEDTENEDVLCGCNNRCAHAVIDYTNSYGAMDAGLGYKCYCNKFAELTALGAPGLAILAAFKPQCMNGYCPHFAVDQPTAVYSQAQMAGIILSAPWKWTQQTADVGGEEKLERFGKPSLAALAGLKTYTPNGYHEKRDYGRFTGGWAKAVLWEESGAQVVHAVPGLEFLEQKADGSYPYPGAAGDYGPGGNRFAKYLDYGFETGLSDTNDAWRALRGQAGVGAVHVHKYDWGLANECGKRQRFARTKVFFGRVGAGAETQEYPDGTVQNGWWTAALAAQEAEDGNTAWRRKYKIKPLRYDKTRNDIYGGSKITVEVAEAAFANGVLTLWLKQKTTTVTSLTSGQTETATTLACAGGNVALPDYAAFSNYTSDRAVSGQRKDLALAGDKLVFTDAAFAGEAIGGRGFPITFAKAASSAAHVGKWKPDWESGQDDEAWYTANVAYHVGLPPALHDWGSRLDEIRAGDEGGLIAAWVAANGVNDLVGLELTVKSELVALAAGASFYSSGPSTADALLLANQYLWLPADGELYTAARHTCLWGDLYLADRTTFPSAAEATGLVRTLEKIMEE